MSTQTDIFAYLDVLRESGLCNMYEHPELRPHQQVDGGNNK